MATLSETEFLKAVIYCRPTIALLAKFAHDFYRGELKNCVRELGYGCMEESRDHSAPPFDREKWFASHGAEQTRPPIDKVLAALNYKGITGLGATGYYVGARYVMDLAFDGVIQASAISHLSRLVIPDDLEAQADKILGNGKFAPGYRREYFEGCSHGFAVRGNMSDPKVKAAQPGKEGAFKACVEWFLKHL
ncbi:alpha/beta-hydrolase [Mycena latifolia]|nr:alpha/beta-hydrolase [Mycena latifolia]